MRKIFLGFVIALVLLITPILSFSHVANAKITPDCGVSTPMVKMDANGKPVIDAQGNPIYVVDGLGNKINEIKKPCNFDDLITLVNNIINFLLITIAAPLVALILCYAGFILLTSGGSPEKMTKAKGIIKNVVLGYIIALAAWLIINTILKTFGFTGNSFLK